MIVTRFRRYLTPLFLGATALAVAACADIRPDNTSEEYVEVARGISSPKSVADANRGGRLTGEDGLQIFGGRGDDN